MNKKVLTLSAVMASLLFGAQRARGGYSYWRDDL